jgi:hypothetical protein
VRKPDDLKATLLAQVSHLREHPETLSLFIDNGRVTCRPTGTLSFAYVYKLNLVVQDFAGDLDRIIVPLLAWVAVNEPDLLERAPSQPFTFESELLDSGAQDVSIDIELTELVRVTTAAGGVNVEHLPEPPRVEAFSGMPDTPVALLAGIAVDLASGAEVIVPELDHG